AFERKLWRLLVSLRGLLPLLLDRPEFRRLRQRLAPGAAAPVLSGVTEAARPYIVAALAVTLDCPLLYVVRRDDELARPASALGALLGRDVPVLTDADGAARPYERLMPDVESVQARMSVLTALSRPRGAMVVVCSARALTQPVMPLAEFANSL